MGAISPFTCTQPWAIHSSASRREHRPSSARRLFRRDVPEAAAEGFTGTGARTEAVRPSAAGWLRGPGAERGPAGAATGRCGLNGGALGSGAPRQTLARADCGAAGRASGRAGLGRRCAAAGGSSDAAGRRSRGRRGMELSPRGSSEGVAAGPAAGGRGRKGDIDCIFHPAASIRTASRYRQVRKRASAKRGWGDNRAFQPMQTTQESTHRLMHTVVQRTAHNDTTARHSAPCVAPTCGDHTRPGTPAIAYKKTLERSAARSSTRSPPYSTRIAPCACSAASASFTRWRDSPTR